MASNLFKIIFTTSEFRLFPPWSTWFLIESNFGLCLDSLPIVPTPIEPFDDLGVVGVDT